MLEKGKQCLICKKELAKDNKGFFCKYHEELIKEKAKKYGAGGIVAAATLLVIHNPEFLSEMVKEAASGIMDKIDL